MQAYQNIFILSKVNFHVKIYFERVFYSSKLNVFKGGKAGYLSERVFSFVALSSLQKFS